MTGWRTRTALVVFLAGSIGAVVWALPDVRDSVTFPDSGGIGVWSIGLVGLCGYLLPLVIALVLARQLRQRGRWAGIARWSHFVSTLVLLAPIVAFTTALFSGAFTHGVEGFWRVMLVALMVAGALWLPLQAFFVSTFAALLIAPGPPPTRWHSSRAPIEQANVRRHDVGRGQIRSAVV